MNHIRIIQALTLLLLCFALPAQAQQAPKREFRGAWIATVQNIDWPSRTGLSVDEMRQELTRMLDTLKSLNLNAVIFQVRPAADAFYDSPYEPWSQWLSGTQGQAPSPYFDPLGFMVDECHRRGMELHAWFNPFRVAMDTLTENKDSRHISRRQPDWVLRYGGRMYLDPGMAPARLYVMKVMMDVVRRYDIDAVHIDDYFYPYPVPGRAFPDSASYRRFGREKPLAEWRRENVNRFVQDLSDSIRIAKNWVRLGVSPFGVWRNASTDPEGSQTRAGVTSYDDLYADVRLWIREGWIQYIMPQNYWSIGFPPADYAEVLRWWSRNSSGNHLYIGQALYKLNNHSDPNWSKATEFPDQIRMMRSFPQARGLSFFSSKWLYVNVLGLKDSLRHSLFRYPAIPPSWGRAFVPISPLRLKPSASKEGVVFKWEQSWAPLGAEWLAFYRYPKREKVFAQSPEHLAAVIKSGTGSWTDTAPRGRYRYQIVALSRNWYESEPSFDFKGKSRLRVPKGRNTTP